MPNSPTEGFAKAYRGIIPEHEHGIIVPCAGVAQWIEQLPSKQSVARSSRAARATTSLGMLQMNEQLSNYFDPPDL
jgi:hypothetical protein